MISKVGQVSSISRQRALPTVVRKMPTLLSQDSLLATGSLLLILLISAGVIGLPCSVYIFLNTQKPYPGIPLIGGDGRRAESKKRYIANATDYVASAVAVGRRPICANYHCETPQSRKGRAPPRRASWP